MEASSSQLTEPQSPFERRPPSKRHTVILTIGVVAFAAILGLIAGALVVWDDQNTLTGTTSPAKRRISSEQKTTGSFEGPMPEWPYIYATCSEFSQLDPGCGPGSKCFYMANADLIARQCICTQVSSLEIK